MYISFVYNNTIKQRIIINKIHNTEVVIRIYPITFLFFLVFDVIRNLDDKNITVISSAIVIKIRNAHDNNISRPPS